jgi:hypothetical protein
MTIRKEAIQGSYIPTKQMRQTVRLHYLGLVAAYCVVLQSCQLPNTLPITDTDGSHSKLPAPATRVVVWGTHTEAVNSLTTWLLKRGYTVVDGLKIKQLAREHNSPTLLSDVEVLRLATDVGATEVIFVDADVLTWKIPDVLEVFGRSPNAYKATVAIRALDAETGEIDWSGKALSVDRFPDLATGIHALTCNALATSWGLRKPGVTVDTNICPQGHNVMVLNDTSSPSQDIVKSPPPQLGAHRGQ